MTAIDTVPVAATHGPDRLTVQFPAKRVTDDTERPVFPHGRRRRRPAYLWRWKSAPDAARRLGAA